MGACIMQRSGWARLLRVVITEPTELWDSTFYVFPAAGTQHIFCNPYIDGKEESILLQDDGFHSDATANNPTLMHHYTFPYNLESADLSDCSFLRTIRGGGVSLQQGSWCNRRSHMSGWAQKEHSVFFWGLLIASNNWLFHMPAWSLEQNQTLLQ